MTAAQIVDQYTDAWVRGDIAGARALLADNLSFEGTLEKHDTADGFVTGLRMFREQLFAGFTPLRRVADADAVFKLYDCKLVTGETLRCAEHFSVANGKIAAIRLTFDSAKVPHPPRS
jgi:ketosteroid isomerase-like protein